MKRIMIAFAVASIFAACNNNTKTNSQEVSARDSVKMLQYSMKAMRDSLKIDSLQRVAENAKLQQQQAAAQRVAYSAAPKRQTYVKGVSESYYYTPTPVQQKKKGWSSAAKGAVIGAGAGAVTGVLVDKKDGRGAVIGGLLGAGTGYVIGRSKDKKTGRAQ
ncbi:YMGG-like glycine zipper-containing protein [Desertivirga xinjiangensis]|uniref:YMGG-like glycine zipper-containing protein n=1 Tax=Desertivirga xinjiangensis TaxID=539206 RepID=UPI00210F1A60|nr:YMGG-like glycine zipper-containing protein [Pedobacter xinjiangensis]